MTLRSTSQRGSTLSLSFDDVVNDLCAALLEHELRVQSSRRGGECVPQFEVDQLRCKIARCEGWLSILGKRVALEAVKARAAAALRGDPPVRNQRLPLDIDVDTRLRNSQAPATRTGVAVSVG